MLWLAILCMILLDFIWLSLMSNRYDKMVRKVQGKPLKMNIIGAIIAYAAMIIGFIYIVLPLARKYGYWYGALFGFIVYAIYNGTNYAIFEDYDWRIALIDTTWGTFLFGVITYIAMKI